MNPLTTVRQLAAIAGVSKSTVSLALRNHPSIAAATREHVQKLAKIHGYVPDPVVSSLMNKLRSGRTQRAGEKLAFLTMWPERRDKDQNYRDYLQGARERAAMLGYELEVFKGKTPGMTAQRLSTMLYTRGIRGIIIPGLPQPKGHLSLDWQHFAAVSISHTVFKPDLHRVSHFHFEGMMLALRQLKKYGFKRIGYANTMDQDERGHHGWLAAYLAYYFIHPKGSQIPPFFEQKWNAQKFKAWVKQHQVEVVLSNWILPTMKARRAGIEVPAGIRYVSLDVQNDDSQADESIAGIDQQAKVLGMSAVDVVVAHTQRCEYGLPPISRITHITGVWRDGASLLKRQPPKAV